MPYDVRQNYGGCSGYAVVAANTGRVVGCHVTRGAADRQRRALYASVGDVAKGAWGLESVIIKYSDDQPRDEQGRFGEGNGGVSADATRTAADMGGMEASTETERVGRAELLAVGTLMTAGLPHAAGASEDDVVNFVNAGLAEWMDRAFAKDEVATQLAADAGVSYEFANLVVGAWASTSNDSSRMAMDVQQAAAEEFGGELSPWQQNKLAEMDASIGRPATVVSILDLIDPKRPGDVTERATAPTRAWSRRVVTFTKRPLAQRRYRERLASIRDGSEAGFAVALDEFFKGQAARVLGRLRRANLAKVSGQALLPTGEDKRLQAIYVAKVAPVAERTALLVDATVAAARKGLKYSEDQPRDESGRFGEGGGLAVHITQPARATSIMKNGLRPGRPWGDRPPSVYFARDRADLEYFVRDHIAPVAYGHAHVVREERDTGPNARESVFVTTEQYAEVEFTVPEGAAVYEDADDRGLYQANAYRLEQGVPKENIVRITFYERTWEDVQSWTYDPTADRWWGGTLVRGPRDTTPWVAQGSTLGPAGKLGKAVAQRGFVAVLQPAGAVDENRALLENEGGGVDEKTIAKVARKGLKYNDDQGRVKALDKKTLDELLATLASRVVNINAATASALQALIVAGRAAGYSLPQLANGVPEEDFVGVRQLVAETYANRGVAIARTELAVAQNYVASARYGEAGVRRVEIMDGDGCGWTEHDDPDEADGSVRTLEELEEYPVAHPNCLVAGTQVVAPPLLGAYARRYEGEVVVLRTANEQRLAGTPHHPILTDHGWVPLGELVQGNRVVYSPDPQRIATLIYPDHQEVPTPIEQVAGALLEAHGGTAGTVPVAPEDFHGDGVGGNVHVVATHRQAQPGGHGQELLELAVQVRDVVLPGLVGARPGVEVGVGADHAPDGGVGSVGTWLTELVAMLLELGVQRGRAVATLAGELAEALPGLVGLVEVIEVQRDLASCHVYNLETWGGWYLANSIVTHNCVRTPLPVVEDLDAWSGAVLKYSDDPMSL